MSIMGTYSGVLVGVEEIMMSYRYNRKKQGCRNIQPASTVSTGAVDSLINEMDAFLIPLMPLKQNRTQRIPSYYAVLV